jgi:hypothetical protein
MDKTCLYVALKLHNGWSSSDKQGSQ